MSPAEEKQQLLGAAIGVAELQLNRRQFLHFAATLGRDKKAQTFFTEDLERNASRAELRDYWAFELGSRVDPETRALCYCAHVRVPLGERGLVPCVFVHFEQIGGDAEDLVFPCEQGADSKFVLAQALVQPGRHEIFPQKH